MIEFETRFYILNNYIINIFETITFISFNELNNEIGSFNILFDTGTTLNYIMYKSMFSFIGNIQETQAHWFL